MALILFEASFISCYHYL